MNRPVTQTRLANKSKSVYSVTACRVRRPADHSVSKDNRKNKPLIYIVDDQPMLLDLAEVSLQADGYTIKKFEDPEEALESFLKAKPKPALLITDYAMGKMNGLELMEKCKEAQPELKTILMSGTAGAEIVLESQVKVDRFIGKPYQPANLSDLVKRVLAELA